MKALKLWILIASVASLLGVMIATVAAADAAKDTAATVTGKSSCGGCSGVVDGCCLMLTDQDLASAGSSVGDSDSLKAAFKVRHGGKTMTATLAGKPETKKGNDGGEYKEVKVSEVKIQS